MPARLVPWVVAIAATAAGCNELAQKDSESSIDGSFLIKNMEPVIAPPGTTVELEGLGLAQDINISFKGYDGDVRIKSSGMENATFQVPKTSAGMTKVVISRGNSKAKFPFVVTNGDSGLPLLAGNGKTLCQGQYYRTLNGSKKEGKRNCRKPPKCSRDGETGCISTAAFPPAQAAKLPDAVAPGKNVAGIKCRPK